LIVFCVQFATEFTSAAAPRTVLQAANPTTPPIKTTVTSFPTMIASPFWVRNDHGRWNGCLSTGAYLQVFPLIVFSVQFATEFTSRAAPRTVLHAAAASAAPIRSTVAAFWNIFVLLFRPSTRMRGKGSIPPPQSSRRLSMKRR